MLATLSGTAVPGVGASLPTDVPASEAAPADEPDASAPHGDPLADAAREASEAAEDTDET